MSAQVTDTAEPAGRPRYPADGPRDPFENLVRSRPVGHLGAFVLVAALVIVTPGPDTALTIRNALGGGRRGGVLTSAGVASGQAAWALAASAGLAAVLAASQPAFLAVRLAGAAYLVCLGVHSLRSAARPAKPGRERPVGLGSDVVSAYRQGLLSNLGNPKMAIFFMSVLPQFAGRGSFAAMLELGIVFAAMTFAWLSGYAAVVARIGDALARTGIRRLLDAVTGAALIAVGLRVATE
jgi:threonine/homoserine/homoserine lactone efflux protein